MPCFLLAHKRIAFLVLQLAVFGISLTSFRSCHAGKSSCLCAQLHEIRSRGFCCTLQQILPDCCISSFLSYQHLCRALDCTDSTANNTACRRTSCRAGARQGRTCCCASPGTCRPPCTCILKAGIDGLPHFRRRGCHTGDSISKRIIQEAYLIFPAVLLYFLLKLLHTLKVVLISSAHACLEAQVIQLKL